MTEQCSELFFRTGIDWFTASLLNPWHFSLHNRLVVVKHVRWGREGWTLDFFPLFTQCQKLHQVKWEIVFKKCSSKFWLQRHVLKFTTRSHPSGVVNKVCCCCCWHCHLLTNTICCCSWDRTTAATTPSSSSSSSSGIDWFSPQQKWLNCKFGVIFGQLVPLLQPRHHHPSAANFFLSFLSGQTLNWGKNCQLRLLPLSQTRDHHQGATPPHGPHRYLQARVDSTLRTNKTVVNCLKFVLAYTMYRQITTFLSTAAALQHM